MSVTGAYELGRPEGATAWDRVRVYEVRGEPFEGPFEEFFVGEPVHLKEEGLTSERVRPLLRAHKIWWVSRFEEIDGAGSVHVARSRYGKDELRVAPTSLEKLNAMERLAAEYAY